MVRLQILRVLSVMAPRRFDEADAAPQAIAGWKEIEARYTE
jgi:hypothetical protein